MIELTKQDREWLKSLNYLLDAQLTDSGVAVPLGTHISPTLARLILAAEELEKTGERVRFWVKLEHGESGGEEDYTAFHDALKKARGEA